MASQEQFDDLKTLIMGIDKKVTVFSTQLNKVERNLTKLERGVQGMDAQIQFIENDKLEKQKIELQKQIDDLKEQAVLLEKHDRKYNILIYGIDDTKKDENVYAITRKLFSEDMHIDERKANAIPIANAHRVPTHGKGPKPIIVRFLHFGDKQLIMSNAHNLKGKKIRILDDLPISMKEERYLLSHNAYKIRKRDKLQTRIRAKGAHMTLETRKDSSEEWSTWG
ncbi:unnamed protein product [Mytilus edulis]|uniref:Uncharacterized protein n=1 Tax=Mytilus edulis TaxID=6550 RepID=A0A8S3PTZ9_MYTED|nr:unnamed protein product [Mytilus edulis]